MRVTALEGSVKGSKWPHPIGFHFSKTWWCGRSFLFFAALKRSHMLVWNDHCIRYGKMFFFCNGTLVAGLTKSYCCHISGASFYHQGFYF